MAGSETEIEYQILGSRRILSFSPDDRMMLASGSRGLCLGCRVGKEIPHPAKGISCVAGAFSPESALLATVAGKRGQPTEFKNWNLPGAQVVSRMVIRMHFREDKAFQ